MVNICFHIGLHKTATTTLQQDFFPKCSELNFLMSEDSIAKEFVNTLISKDILYYDWLSNRKLLDKCLSDNKPNLVSFESLSGPPFSGMHHGIDCRTPILMKLRQTYPEAKIFLVIRKQNDLARSFYRQYIKFGGSASISDFFGYTAKRSRQAIMPFERFKYGPYLDELYKSFPNNVLVIPFELFKESKKLFLKTIASFLGVSMPAFVLRKRNVSKLGPFGMEVTRFLNRLSPFSNQITQDRLLRGVPILNRSFSIRFVNPMSIVHDYWPGFIKTNKRYKDYYDVCDHIFESVKDDNANLDIKYNLNLKYFGYY